MKHLLILFTAAMLLVSPAMAQKTVRIATYNLRLDNRGDVGNFWENRGPVVANLIRFHDFDVVGTQEGLQNQVEDLSKWLPQYARYGKGRDDGSDKGEHSAIFYRKDKFKVLKSGDFWLSETPDKPGLGWDATCCNRICSWVYLQPLKGGKKFYVFNVHFDHQGMVARVESGKLMLQKIAAIAGSAPVVLTGDFNGNRESEWYKTLANSGILHDTVKDVEYPYANNATFNAFGKELEGYAVIDHIFGTSGIKATKWGILTDTYHGKMPSDHFPVMADVTIK
ncbi:endonuclease/exonuclease/phosphatase family protein [Hufsiella ginkgonis]|uniref:Endonuclease n=1 Tax=Hufsiella ginkgonis TaxID=2695274 RepID=A0A7K1XTC4_9SPHI|nr:endonuclease/exonuclease/phosphatase family protein [Hufsiella ginkgonis]MXV14263.1 endonuclease [Hufsiella ginkgonis]